MQAGAVSFLTKPCPPDDLWNTILEALERCRVALDARIRNRTIEQRLSTLTHDEQAVLSKVLAGTPNKLIARDLGIAEGTVKVHVKHLLKKLNLRSRVEAAVWADRCRRQAKP